MNAIGIMQGRLLPPTRGRIQAFPVDAWREEFRRASIARLSCIEWIYEQDTASDNPLGTDDGLAEIRRVMDDTGVPVRSVCGDYYMPERLVAEDGAVRAGVVDHLRWLIERTALVGAGYLVLPFVDASSLSTDAERDGLAEVLSLALPAADKAGIGLHLETDLSADVLLSIMRDRVPHPLLRITCDIGNEASLGYDPRQHWSSLGPWLGSVHVKDRVLGGGTAPLGDGDADIGAFFAMFASAGYRGTFIMQIARGQDGDEVALAERNRDTVARRWAAATGDSHAQGS